MDDKKLDGTSSANPAYWRGAKKTLSEMCRCLEEILSGEDDGAGEFSNERFEAIRRDLLKRLK